MERTRLIITAFGYNQKLYKRTLRASRLARPARSKRTRVLAVGRECRGIGGRHVPGVEVKVLDEVLRVVSLGGAGNPFIREPLERDLRSCFVVRLANRGKIRCGRKCAVTERGVSLHENVRLRSVRDESSGVVAHADVERKLVDGGGHGALSEEALEARLTIVGDANRTDFLRGVDLLQGGPRAGVCFARLRVARRRLCNRRGRAVEEDQVDVVKSEIGEVARNVTERLRQEDGAVVSHGEMKKGWERERMRKRKRHTCAMHSACVNFPESHGKVFVVIKRSLRFTVPAAKSAASSCPTPI